MTYENLTLNQKISLKGEFQTNPKLNNYRAIMLLCDFVTAVNFFLKEDISIIYNKALKNGECEY